MCARRQSAWPLPKLAPALSTASAVGMAGPCPCKVASLPGVIRPTPAAKATRAMLTQTRPRSRLVRAHGLCALMLVEQRRKWKARICATRRARLHITSWAARFYGSCPLASRELHPTPAGFGGGKGWSRTKLALRAHVHISAGQGNTCNCCDV